MSTTRPAARLRCETLEARELPASSLYAAVRVESPTRIGIALVDDATRTSSRIAVNFAKGNQITAAAVASGDVTGDGVPDVAVSVEGGTFAPAGPFVLSKSTGRVAVFDGAELRAGRESVLRRLQPYDAGVTGRIHLALGDLTGDGRADLVTAPQGYGPHVRVYDLATRTMPADFYSHDPARSTGGPVAVGDLNGDGRPDLVALADTQGTTEWGSATVFREARTFHTAGPGFASTWPTADRAVYLDAPHLAGGGRLRLAVGQVVGGAGAELFVGSLAGGVPAVTAFGGTGGTFAPVLGSVRYIGLTGTGPTRLLVRDLTGDGRADLRFGSQPIDPSKPVTGNNSDRVTSHPISDSNGRVGMLWRGFGGVVTPFADITSSLDGVEVG